MQSCLSPLFSPINSNLGQAYRGEGILPSDIVQLPKLNMNQSNTIFSPPKLTFPIFSSSLLHPL